MIRSRLAENRRGLGIVVLEMSLIVIGVLLGLAANNWREARLDEQRAEQALDHILDEIERNKQQLEKILPYHKNVSDSLSVLFNRMIQSEHDVSLQDLLTAAPQGFSVSLLEITGWELASRTGAINFMDYEVATYMSKLYGLQGFLQGKLDYIPENLYVARLSDPFELNGMTFALNLLISDIVTHEEELISGYTEVLEKLRDEADE